jgi:hypothetical protein
VRAVWDGARVDCTFANEPGESGLVQWTPGASDVSAPTGAGGLRTYNSSITFESFVLYL